MTQEPATARAAATSVPMTAEQRVAFDRDGYLIIGGALGPDEVAAAGGAVDRVYAAMDRAGSLGPGGSMHLLSAVANCPDVAGLIDHPATFGCPWRSCSRGRLPRRWPPPSSSPAATPDRAANHGGLAGTGQTRPDIPARPRTRPAPSR